MAKDDNIEAILAQQAQALSALTSIVTSLAEKAKLGEAETANVNERMAAAMESISATQEQALRRTQRPSNEIVPNVSAFNLRGELLDNNDIPEKDRYRKPVLRCKMYLPWEAENESLTREEVELLNLVVMVPGEYLITRNDDTTARLTVQTNLDMSRSKPAQMLMTHDTAFSNENARYMPPLRSILRQILEQSGSPLIRKQSREVLTTEDEKARILSGELSVSR